jgi:hypothetical protein
MPEPDEDAGVDARGSARERMEPQKPPADDAPSKGDYFAIGLGCLVVIIFFIAIVVVGMTRE